MALEDGTRGHTARRLRSGRAAPTPGVWPVGSFIGGLHGAARADLLNLGSHRLFVSEEKLLHEGDRSNHVVLLHSGFAKVTARLENGREALLAIRSAGDVVGEMAAIDDAPRSATVTACGSVSANVVPNDELQSFLRRRPEVAITLAGMVVRRLRWANRRRVEFGGLPVKVRLARVLAELASRHGHSVRRHLIIGVTLSQPELAALTGAAEITVHKALRDLRGDGLLTTGYRRITVLDLRRLRQTAGLPAEPLNGD